MTSYRVLHKYSLGLRAWVGRKTQKRSEWTETVEFAFYLSMWPYGNQNIHLAKDP